LTATTTLWTVDDFGFLLVEIMIILPCQLGFAIYRI
jgi:hypothetical protein